LWPLAAGRLTSIGAKNWNSHVVMTAIAVGALPATVAFGSFENRLQQWIKRLICQRPANRIRVTAAVSFYKEPTGSFHPPTQMPG
jgi:sulfite exporter TauE/SafE